TRRRARILAALAAGVLLVVGCSPGAGPELPRPELQLVSSLRPFDSCDELRTWARDELAPRVGAYGFPGSPVPLAAREPVVDDSVAGAEVGRDGAGLAESLQQSTPAGPGDVPTGEARDGGSPEFSETNVQVAGIDEPDTVKTDGERILAVAGGRLHLASAQHAEIVDAVDLPEGVHDASMLLSGDRVLLFSTTWLDQPVGIAQDGPALLPAPGAPATRVVQVAIDG